LFLPIVIWEVGSLGHENALVALPETSQGAVGIDEM